MGPYPFFRAGSLLCDFPFAEFMFMKDALFDCHSTSRCFSFNRNGSNGRVLAGVWCSAEDDRKDLLITQVRSPMSRLGGEEILLQNRQGRGMPYIMAIMDDVVTGVYGVDRNQLQEE